MDFQDAHKVRIRLRNSIKHRLGIYKKHIMNGKEKHGVDLKTWIDNLSKVNMNTISLCTQ